MSLTLQFPVRPEQHLASFSSLFCFYCPKIVLLPSHCSGRHVYSSRELKGGFSRIFLKNKISLYKSNAAQSSLLGLYKCVVVTVHGDTAPSACTSMFWFLWGSVLFCKIMFWQKSGGLHFLDCNVSVTQSYIKCNKGLLCLVMAGTGHEDNWCSQRGQRQCQVPLQSGEVLWPSLQQWPCKRRKILSSL